MEAAEKITLAKKALEQGKGILRLAPNWVPRSFCVPGRRIKLHPDDYYVLGGSVVVLMNDGFLPLRRQKTAR